VEGYTRQSAVSNYRKAASITQGTVWLLILPAQYIVQAQSTRIGPGYFQVDGGRINNLLCRLVGTVNNQPAGTVDA
jgi:hypothetical protein